MLEVILHYQNHLLRMAEPLSQHQDNAGASDPLCLVTQQPFPKLQ